MEASGGSPTWQSFVQVDTGEQEPETLEIDPHWRATRWLQVAIQGIVDEEVPWYELVTPLTSGDQGWREWFCPWPSILLLCGSGTSSCMGRMTAHLLRPSSILVSLLWMRKQQGAWESHTGLWPTPVHCSGWARWPMGDDGSGQGGKPWSPAFWHKTGMDLTVASIKLCWEPTPRALYHKRDNGSTAHVIF